MAATLHAAPVSTISSRTIRSRRMNSKFITGNELLSAAYVAFASILLIDRYVIEYLLMSLIVVKVRSGFQSLINTFEDFQRFINRSCEVNIIVRGKYSWKCCDYCRFLLGQFV